MENILFSFVCGISKAVFASISYVSEIKLPKYLGFSEVVSKVVSTKVQLNYSYSDAVCRRIEKSGGDASKWQKGGLLWGEWVKGQENKIITYKGNYYLRFYCMKNQPLEITYYVGNREATAEEVAAIKAYKAKGSKPKKQLASGVSEENLLYTKDVKFDGILSLATDKFVYQRNKEEKLRA